MTINLLFTGAQIILSIMLMTLVVLQGGGAGLSGSATGYTNYFSSKRGFDKYMFIATIACAVSFVLISAITVFLSK